MARDRFYLGSAAILAELLQSFPNPIDLNLTKIASSVTEDEISEGEAFDFFATLPNIAAWLADEGFFRFKDVSTLAGRKFNSAVLTLPGLRALQKVIAGAAVGPQIVQAIADRNLGVVDSLMRQTITQ